MLIRLNSILRAQRRRLALTLAAAAIVVALVSAHSAMSGGDHMDMSTEVAMCLAVVETALLAAAAVLGLRPPSFRLRLAWFDLSSRMDPPRPASEPRVRAGPEALQVFLE